MGLGSDVTIEYVEDENNVRRRLVDSSGRIKITPGTSTSATEWQPKHVTASSVEASVTFSPAVASGWIYNKSTTTSARVGFNVSTSVKYNEILPQQVINFEFTMKDCSSIYYKTTSGTADLEIFAV